MAGVPIGPDGSASPDTTNIARSATDGTPAGWDTFGVDGRVLTGQLPADPAKQTITAATDGDAWLLGAVAVVTPA